MTREPQYEECFAEPFVKLGPMASHSWRHDPRTLLFRMARYKFVAKMLREKGHVAEIGCGDGWLSAIVAQEVPTLDLYDFDPMMAGVAQAGLHDIVAAPLPILYDAIYMLDVLEHIAPADTAKALTHISDSLTNIGVAIIGMPSLESQQYASEMSKAGHVNCMTGDDFHDLLQCFFGNVFLFSMSDEVVHTGFTPMAHYLIAVCVCG